MNGSQFAGFFAEAFLRHAPYHPEPDLLELLIKTAGRMYSFEYLPPQKPAVSDPLAQARYKDALTRFQRIDNQAARVEWITTVIESFSFFLAHLPRTTGGPFEMSITATQAMIDHLVVPFRLNNNPEFFAQLKRTLAYNYEKKNPTPRDLLANTPLTPLLSLTLPFGITEKRFASHGVIIAPPNHGKTQLLSSIIHTFLPSEIGVILLDPHGDLFNVLKTRVDPERLVVLDPDTNPPPLNFFDFGNSTPPQALQTFEYLMSAISGGLSDKQGGVVPYLLKLLRLIPDASLETLRQLVDEKVKKPEQSQFAQYVQKLPEVDQAFFRNQFFGHSMQVTKDAIAWKLYSALSSDTFREMFSAKTNSFHADQLLNEQKVVLIKGSRKSLGEHGMQVFLQFIVSQFYAAALRREDIPPEKRKLCILFVDEAHHVFNPQISNVLTECRKYALGFMAATQVIEQIPTEVKAAIYGATAIKIAGPVSHSDAFTLAREMHANGDAIRALRSTERSHSEWMVYVQNETQAAVKVTAPFGVLERLPQYPTPKPPQRAASDPVPRVARAVSSTPPIIQNAQAPPKESLRGGVNVRSAKDIPIIPPATKRPQTEERDTLRKKPEPPTPDNTPTELDQEH